MDSKIDFDYTARCTRHANQQSCKSCFL